MQKCDDNVFVTQESIPKTVTKAMHLVTAGLGVLMIAANVEEKGFYGIVDVTVVFLWCNQCYKG